MCFGEHVVISWSWIFDLLTSFYSSISINFDLSVLLFELIQKKLVGTEFGMEDRHFWFALIGKFCHSPLFYVLLMSVNTQKLSFQSGLPGSLGPGWGD